MQLHLRIVLYHFLKHVSNFLFLLNEFTKFLVERVDVPDSIFVKFICILVFAISSYHRDVKIFTAEQFKHFVDLTDDVLLAYECRIFSTLFSGETGKFVQNPLGLFLKF
jgi:hypothetical protein